MKMTPMQQIKALEEAISDLDLCEPIITAYASGLSTAWLMLLFPQIFNLESEIERIKRWANKIAETDARLRQIDQSLASTTKKG